MRTKILHLLTTLGMFLAPATTQACGADSNCAIGDRHYRIYVPEALTSTSPQALIFAHGFRGSAEGIMRNSSLRNWADTSGVVLIALKSAGPDWDIPFAPRTYDSDGKAEESYVQNVLEDAGRRFGIDRSQVVMSGFSAGGMVTWHMACHRPDLFSGFIPMAGTFWLQTPQTCNGPVRSLVHIHGDADKVVPFEGRQIRNTHQGNIFEALDLYRNEGGFSGAFAETFNDLSCSFEQNHQGSNLGFCEFPGGHEFKVSHLAYAWKQVTK